MPKLIDQLRAASAPHVPSDDEVDLQNFADNTVKLADHLVYHVNALALLAQKRGLNFFASQVGGIETLQGLLALTQQLWAAGTDSPFPDFPVDAPAPTPTPTPTP